LAYTKQRFILTLVVLYFLLLLILDYAGVDIWLAKTLYHFEGIKWSLKHHWLTEDVIHKGGRLLNYIGIAVVLAMTIYWNCNKIQSDKRDAYNRLCLSLTLSFISVNYLKAITNIDCPWDLSMFGGDMPYVHLFSDKPDWLPLARCFPAGHASAGYAWIALYYFFRRVAPRLQLMGLILGLSLGFIFGIAQQLRGAHFLSHDLTTLFLCWLIAFCVFNVGNNCDNTVKRSL